ncbi:MAG: hypothetical protein OJF62_002503 [Pseudolabrys sp.]|nr:hypothetical protein [Pseudolabrys sp.]
MKISRNRRALGRNDATQQKRCTECYVATSSSNSLYHTNCLSVNPRR